MSDGINCYVRVQATDWTAAILPLTVHDALTLDGSNDGEATPLGDGTVIIELQTGQWTQEDLDAGDGTILRRRVLPAAVKALALSPAVDNLRAALKRDVEGLVALSVAELQAIATEEGVDTTGLTTKREAAVEIVRHRHPELGNDIPKESLADIRARFQAATNLQIKRWCYRRGIDITEATTRLEAANIIADALGLLDRIPAP